MPLSRLPALPLVLLSAVSATLGVSVAAVPSPAHAGAPLDASGAEFSFVAPTDVLTSAGVGDSYDYESVATIDGFSIDARLTVVELFNSLDGTPSVFVSQNALELINGLKAQQDPPLDALTTTGCYRDFLVDGEPFGSPTYENTLPSDYLVGAELFDDTTAWSTDSPFIVGSLLETGDEAEPGDPEEDVTIKTELTTCGGVDFFTSPPTGFSNPGYVRLQLDFTTGVDRTPVQLTNLTLSAFDIDGGQYLRLFSPLPDDYRVFETSLLDVCGPEQLVPANRCVDAETYAGSSEFLDTTGDQSLEFYGADSSEDGEVYEWAAEAIYTQPISSITYQFGKRSGGGGSSLEVGFTPILDGEGSAPELAATGQSPNVATGFMVAALVLLLGSAIILRRSRTARA